MLTTAVAPPTLLDRSYADDEVTHLQVLVTGHPSLPMSHPLGARALGMLFNPQASLLTRSYPRLTDEKTEV